MDSRRILRKDRLLTCPYDPVHRVEEGTRYQRHLIECRKNHPEINEVVCEFNRTHRVKATDYPYHIKHCPDNYIIHKEIIKLKNEFPMQPSKDIEIIKFDPPPSTEDWEQEVLPEPICIRSLNQNNNKQLKFVNADVLSGLKPRQKKKFRKNLCKDVFPLNFDDDSDEEQQVKENMKINCQTQVQQQQKETQNKDSFPESLASKISKLRQPSEIPMAAVPSLHLMNAGRGLNPAYRSPRIAANIFGGTSTDVPKLGSSNSFATAGIGRGQMLEIRKKQKLQNNDKTSETNLNILTSPETSQMADAEEENIQTNVEALKQSEEVSNFFGDNYKLKRKLEKKLKQIEMLEKKTEIMGISSLNMDEVNKLNSKNEVIQQLVEITKENPDK